MNQLKEIRVSKGYMQKEVAELVGMSPQTYCKLEANGKRFTPVYDTALKVVSEAPEASNKKQLVLLLKRYCIRNGLEYGKFLSKNIGISRYLPRKIDGNYEAFTYKTLQKLVKGLNLSDTEYEDLKEIFFNRALKFTRSGKKDNGTKEHAKN